MEDELMDIFKKMYLLDSEAKAIWLDGKVDPEEDARLKEINHERSVLVRRRAELLGQELK